MHMTTLKVTALNQRFCIPAPQHLFLACHLLNSILPIPLSSSNPYTLRLPRFTFSPFTLYIAPPCPLLHSFLLAHHHVLADLNA